ncbi:MAG TPA: MFS transporter [Candidatus Saccharimonadia bacterium]|nr:MFS transporter [Candidatus Saccharimonadia bacterium]
MQPAVKRTIRKIYAYKTVREFILLYPLYNIMFASHGISTLQISTLLIIWSLTDVVTTIPTGVLADKFSRKHLLAFGQLLEALGFLTWWLWPAYAGFALGFMLWGVGGSLDDGTYEAVVFDELKQAGIESQYVKVTGRAASLSLMADCLATALAGIAVIYGYHLVIAGSIVAVIAAGLIALWLPNTPRFEPVHEQHYLSMLTAGVREAFQNRLLLALIVLGSFVGTIYGVLEEYVPLFFHQTGLSLQVVPPLVAVTVLVAALASFIAHRFEHLSTRTFMALLFASGLCLMLAGIALGLAAIALIVAYTFFIKLLSVIYDGKIQHSIRGGLRATVTSVSFVVMEVMSIATYLIYGLLSRYGGNFTAFTVIGAFVSLVALAYLILAPRLLSGRFQPLSG